MSDLVKTSDRPAVIRPPIGLLLSIGDITTSRGGKEIPTKIDHFRAKPGQLGQYEGEAERFAEVYGAEPKQIPDVYFLSDLVGDVLDVRLRCWGTSGLRGVGLTNFALLPEAEFEQRAFAYEDDFLFFPLEAKEVRAELRDSWQGEPIQDVIEGPDDPRVKKLGISVEATLSFCLPEVMGVGKVAQITTKGRRSIRNLYSGTWDNARAFRRLAGIPFRLSVRPARTRRFDREERRYKSVEFFELVLDTPLTVAEILERIRERRDVLEGGDHLALPAGESGVEAAGRILQQAMGLPLPEDEDVRTRDEPTTFERPSDALLNRIAQAEAQVPDPSVYLSGAFGVESAEDLSQAQAEQYLAGLERYVTDHPAEEVAVEVVEEQEQGAFEIPEAAKKGRGK